MYINNITIKNFTLIRKVHTIFNRIASTTSLCNNLVIHLYFRTIPKYTIKKSKLKSVFSLTDVSLPRKCRSYSLLMINFPQSDPYPNGVFEQI